MDTRIRRAFAWLEERIGLSSVRELANKKTVPLHRHTVWYYFGGMTLFLFMIQIGTGILLMLYYRPSAEGAYESVQFIMTQVPFGWLIRSIHSWSANLMVALALVHLFSVFFLKAYRAPRELTWVSGFLLLLLTMGFGFSGYLLPWNKLAYFATQVGTDIAGAVPVMGEFIIRFLRGGDHVTGGTLSRFYGWHVAILPAISISLLLVHLLQVQRHGMSVPQDAIERWNGKVRQMPFVPDFLLRDLFGWVLALGILAAIAALFPWELGEKADPFAPAFADIKPEWYFMFMFQTLKWVPGGAVLGVENEALAVLGFGLAGLLGLLVPFLDRRGARTGRSPLFTVIGAFALIYIAVLTAIGYHAWWPAWVTAVIVLGPWIVGKLMARRTLTVLIPMVLIVPLVQAQTEPGRPEGSSCVTCHAELDIDGEEWQRDAHAEAGLGCEACHGGNPAPELAEDPEAAMTEAYGFKPAPGRLEIATFCGDCHADAEFMKRYDPQARVDQLAEYRTSVHGRRNAQGDAKPATCVDCHGVHGIRRVSAADSPVFARNVPETCAQCHADKDLMANYGLPTDQYELYRSSVHGTALLEREDTAAPACNDCHGNHGAAPPGVRSVANVCGQCHGREAKLFRASFKKEIFDALEVAECSVCHGDHGIVHPTPESFRSGSAPEASAGRIVNPNPLRAELGDLESGDVATATWAATLEPRLAAGDLRLDHLVIVTAGGAEPLSVNATVNPGDGETALEPREASNPKMSATLTIEPLSGLPVKSGDAVRYRIDIAPVEGRRLTAVTVRSNPGLGVESIEGSFCLNCHALGDECDQATEKMYAALASAERDLRRAERLLHEAEVAGVDVSGEQFNLKSSGTTAALDSRALIHGFDPEALIARTEDAKGIAAQAIEAGMAALDEVQYRRKGLAVSLVLVALVLLGLYGKIRQLDAARVKADSASGPTVDA